MIVKTRSTFGLWSIRKVGVFFLVNSFFYYVMLEIKVMMNDLNDGPCSVKSIVVVTVYILILLLIWSGCGGLLAGYILLDAG